MQHSSPVSAKYFYEIDFFRAIAVIAVIINHIQKSWLPGGFLGVDVFFVISGFVVTSALTQSQSTSVRASLLRFYQNRLKRIYPALLVCLLIFSVVILIVYPDSQSALATGLWATLGISNMQLLGVSQSYFSPSAETNPFLHTWSLGVEEQFYLIYPFLFYCLSQKKNFVLMLSACFFSSLVIFFVLMGKNSSWAFYVMPARFWQLALGGLVFLLPQTSYFRKFHKNWLIFPSVILCYCFLSSSEFSPAYTLIATFATAAILAFIKETGARSYLLVKPIIAIGAASYSLYLYHWPVIVLTKHTVSIESSLFLIATIVLVSLLAWLSFEFVERRWRRERISLSRLLSLTLTMGALWIGMNFSKEISEVVFIGTPAPVGIRTSKCYYAPDSLKKLESDFANFKEYFFTNCQTNRSAVQGSGRSIYLYGNSHALEKYPAILRYANDQGYKLYFMGISSWYAFSPERSGLCGGLSVFGCFLQTLQKNSSPGDLVIISRPLKYLVSDVIWFEQYQKYLQKVSQDFAKDGVTFYLISGYPYFKESISTVLCNQPWSHHNSSCDLDKAFDAREMERLAAFDKQLQSNAQINYISLWAGVDNLLKQKNPYRFFQNRDHLSVEGIMALYPLIQKEMND